MADDEQRKRIIERMEKDYAPDRTVATEDAMVNALEFIAFRIGRIDDKLKEIR